jgi:hypothetical protein
MLTTTIRSIVTALGMALLLLPADPASAQQARCLAGKTSCMARKAAGLLKCEALAETPGRLADPNANDCVTRTRTKFDGGSQPTTGCFEKLESKSPNDCLTVDDTGAAETAVDACVASLVAAIDPPPLDQTQCGAGKKKCAAKYLAGLLKCRKLAQTPGKPTDPNTKGCVDKAVAKYTGGRSDQGVLREAPGEGPERLPEHDRLADGAGVGGELCERARRGRRRPGEHHIHDDAADVCLLLLLHLWGASARRRHRLLQRLLLPRCVVQRWGSRRTWLRM